MVVSEADVTWAQANYPELRLSNSGGTFTLVGTIAIRAVFDDDGQQYIINPSREQQADRTYIEDSYDLEIIVAKDNAILPVVREVGGRVLATAKRLGCPPEDLHVYSDGRICPVGEFDLRKVTNLPQLLDSVVLQFFYDQSHFERTGRWPRGEYAHGLLGVLENYIDNADIGDRQLDQDCFNRVKQYQSDGNYRSVRDRLNSADKIGSHQPCFCLERKMFRTCQKHQRVYRALWRLQKFMRENRLRI